MNAAVASPRPERPDYLAIFQKRAEKLAQLRANPERWQLLKDYYRDGHIDDFINDWGITYDPRNVGTEMPTTMPFVLDQRQREWVRFTWDNWRARKYGGTEKSRDVGISWLLVGFAVALCVLFDGVSCGLGSFKQEKVDKRGEIGSLFEKVRVFVQGLPVELRAGHRPQFHDVERLIVFPQTGSSILGEIGDNIGRGGRTTVYFVDETAYLERDKPVDEALSKNTNCRQDVSSVRGMHNTFAERMHDGNSRKFTFHWRDNPRFTQTDYDEFLQQWGPVITAQELDINYQASVEGVLIPGEWVNSAIDAHVLLGIEPSGEQAAAFDVADQGIDKNAFACRHGILIPHVEHWSGKTTGDIFESVERIFLLCDIHGCDRFVYDADGLGAGVGGDARKINERRGASGDRRLQVGAFRGSAKVVNPGVQDVQGRKNEDFFENLKAQAWWALRVRFQLTYRVVSAFKAGKPIDFNPSNIISIASEIPERSRLVRELSQPVYTQSKSGKLMVDKVPDGVASPNLADAVMMLFSPRKPMAINPALLRDSIDPFAPAP
jgi:phage terminase large subunit